jgi:hypothetical protein
MLVVPEGAPSLLGSAVRVRHSSFVEHEMLECLSEIFSKQTTAMEARIISIPDAGHVPNHLFGYGTCPGAVP